MTRYYKQDQIAVAVRELLEFRPCELLLLEADSWGQGEFRNQEEGEHPPFKAATKQRQWRHDCKL
jgi:hypothetical protein